MTGVGKAVTNIGIMFSVKRLFGFKNFRNCRTGNRNVK